jgi:hypothetical protein
MKERKKNNKNDQRDKTLRNRHIYRRETERIKRRRDPSPKNFTMVRRSYEYY